MSNKNQEIRDPIHGFIELEPDELRIVKHPVFQRLRRIKQLALAYFLYPGATHTRFEHSLGVYELAKQICNNLGLNKEITKIIRVAALVHDIGHGPFSHVSEDSLKKFTKINSDDEVEDIHELIGWDIIRSADDLLPGELKDDVIGFLKGEDKFEPYCEIISGPFDADKQDYLLRDSYYTGVKYGIFDKERLVRALEIKGEDLMIIDEDIHVLEQFFLAKYYISNQVYRHRVRQITDTMINRAIELGIEVDNIEFLRELYSYKKGKDYIDNYLKWDDNKLFQKLIDEYPGSNAAKIVKMLENRNLFKIIYDEKFPFKDFHEQFENIRELINWVYTKGDKRKIEEDVAKILKIDDPKFTILNIFSFGTVSTPRRNGKQIIMVSKKFGDTVRFDEESNLFKSITETQEYDFDVHIYAKVKPEDDSLSRLDRCIRYKDAVHDVIADCFSKAQKKS